VGLSDGRRCFHVRSHYTTAQTDSFNAFHDELYLKLAKMKLFLLTRMSQGLRL